MRNNVLITYIAFDVLFVIAGVLIMVFTFTTEGSKTTTLNADNVAATLLLSRCPSKAGIANAVLIFVTFASSLPAIAMPTTRGWLKAHGYMVVVCAMFTMILGLQIWFDTLKTRNNLLNVWITQPAESRSLIQQKFDCCGYMNSTSPPFVQDAICPNPLVAASKNGCVAPFSSFANNFLDRIFTGAFGIVGVDVLLILSTAMLLKDRKERERYRHIDEKNGAGGF